MLTAVLLALAAPQVAWGSDARIVRQDVPVASVRAPAATPAPPMRFDLVGLHWQGAGTVLFRTRSVGGRWSAWRPAAPESGDGPDPATAEARRAGAWRLGSPSWTGPSNRIQYRLLGRVRRLRAYFVRSDAEALPLRAVSTASSPRILPRSAWEANERIRRSAPLYARTLRFALVHHTAGSNAYSRSESAAIVRAIQLYHVRGNGWNDIAYNFLIDKYGQVFEGRFGGIARNVVGAHAQGFNTGSVGVALLGTFDSSAPPPAARAALTKLLAWRLDVAHVDPQSSLTWASSGNARFAAGALVPLRAISGHRDTGFTECPGGALYRRLPGLARNAAEAGLPKLYAPSVSGQLGGRIRFAGRLSTSLAWTVTVNDQNGEPVASGSGSGTRVGWAWDSTSAAPAPYSWVIAAPGVRPARGTIGSGQPPGPLLSEVAASPPTVTPNGDGQSDSTRIRYRLGASAIVTITLEDAAGATVATLLNEPRSAGRHALRFTAESLADGRYRAVLDAQARDGKRASASIAVLVSRILRAFVVQPERFSPNRDGTLDRLDVSFELTAPAEARLQVRRKGRVLATPLEAELEPGTQQLRWDGSGSAAGGRVADGRYQAVLRIRDPSATVSAAVPFWVDTTPPRVTVVRLRPLRLRVSERATLVVGSGSKRRIIRARPGLIGLPQRFRGARLAARDGAGNRARPVRVP